MINLDKIYKKSPLFIQNIGVSSYALYLRSRRYNSYFHRMMSEYRSNEFLTKEAHERNQERSLRGVLLHAEDSIPYWKNLFFDLKLNKADLANFTLKDLTLIPILNKSTIQDNPDLFMPLGPIKNSVVYSTSGSTGTPLEILFDKEMESSVFALNEVRVREWAGLRHGMSRAMIGGRYIQEASNNKPPFHRYNSIDRQLYFSSNHISSKNAKYYADALEKHRPDYLVGISSSWALLAHFFKEQGIRPPSPRAILCSSDALTKEGKQIIEEVFRARAYNAWSMAESCGLISECESGSFHATPEMGIIEIINHDGIAVKGEPGRIICTGLLNKNQPLIRYDTGDLAQVSNNQKCSCGREMPKYNRIVGRLDEYVWSKDGRASTRLARVWRGIDTIREGQIVQKTLDDIHVNISVRNNFSNSDKQLLISNIQERIGDVNVSVHIVDTIPRNGRGKFKSVVSYVKPKNQDILKYQEGFNCE
jgi:phenylacetate-CoA ligase